MLEVKKTSSAVHSASAVISRSLTMTPVSSAQSIIAFRVTPSKIGPLTGGVDNTPS
jgi:hypothetical protein